MTLQMYSSIEVPMSSFYNRVSGEIKVENCSSYQHMQKHTSFLCKVHQRNLYELYYVDEAASWELLSGNTGGTDVVMTVDFSSPGNCSGCQPIDTSWVIGSDF